MSHDAVLKQADIFYDFTPQQIEKIASICDEKRFGMGELIFEENTGEDELYVIAHGEVEILIDPALVSDRPGSPSQPSTIATLRRGQSFGEIALVDQGIRSASARSASTDTRLLSIPREKLIALCDSDPALGYRLMRNLATDLAMKLRSTDLLMREKLLYEGSSRGDTQFGNEDQ
ncbi:MAG: cyclic nucleotide-binding domain-containing protein [Anaerolineales bacterium]|jgi:CRP-like cAMP-binding protein